MNIVNCEQGSYEWLEVRCGRVTASEVKDAVRFLKRKSNGREAGESSGTRETYKASLVAEIMTGRPADTFVSKYMLRGTEMEPQARQEYEMRFGVDVQRVGFVIHPTIDRAGASPDGLIGEDGGLEIKCPKTETHLNYMFEGRLPPDYEPQVMWNLACTGRKWWDFVSFDDRLLDRHQIFRIRVERNDERIAELEAGVKQFLSEVDEMIARLNALNPEIEAPAKKSGTYDAEFGELGLTDEELALIV